MVRGLKAALEKQKSEVKKIKEEAKKQIIACRVEVKAECDERLRKQMDLCEQMVAKKREMVTQVNALKIELETAEISTAKKLKAQEERFQVDLKRNKEAWLASEKRRRDDWEKNRAEEIKAQTVKSLEPEINNILQRNRIERTQQKQELEGAFREERAKLEAATEKKMKEVKDQLKTERDAAVE